MGAIDNAMHNFIDRVTTVPGENRRKEIEEQAANEAKAASERHNQLMGQLRSQQDVFNREAQYQRDQISRATQRSNRARIRGGIFGDPQPNAIVHNRLGGV